MKFRAVLAAFLAVICVFTLSGCSSGTAASAPDGPGSVATRAVTSLANGDAATFKKLTAPNQRQVISHVPSSLPVGNGSATNIAVGSLIVNGQSAKVVLTGTLCLRIPTTNTSPSAKAPLKCVTNGDAQTLNPLFIQYLIRIGSTWYISSQASTAFR
jgi:hypothetical protein